MMGEVKFDLLVQPFRSNRCISAPLAISHPALKARNHPVLRIRPIPFLFIDIDEANIPPIGILLEKSLDTSATPSRG
jgi:hypothetical protein